MRLTLREKTLSAISALVLLCGALLAWWAPATTLAARLVWETTHAGGIALALDRSDAGLALEIGNFYLEGTAYSPKAADVAYHKSVALDPTLPYAHYQLARVLFVEGSFDAALAAIDAEIRLNPSNGRSYYMRGLIQAYNGKLKSAEQSFTQFVAYEPTEWAGYNDLAWVLGREGKYAQAEKLLNTAFLAVSDAANNVWLWDNLGVQQLNLKEYSAAVASFQRAAALAQNLTDESWHEAYPGNNLSESASGIAQFKEAIQNNLEKAQKATS